MNALESARTPETSPRLHAGYFSVAQDPSLRPRRLKKVIAVDPTWSHEMWQRYYMTNPRPGQRRLVPNVVLTDHHGRVMFQINSDGFKGRELEPNRPKIAFWGDSVIFGLDEGWVEGLERHLARFQFLNGGIEGDALGNICERALEANGELRIERNVLFPGWHSLDRPEVVQTRLADAARRVPGPILSTVPTSLTPEIAEHDLAPYFVSAPTEAEFPDPAEFARRQREMFVFMGTIPYSRRTARRVAAQVVTQNQIVREVAKEVGVPILDFSALLPAGDLATFRQDFFDLAHPRYESYPKIQSRFAEVLPSVLA